VEAEGGAAGGHFDVGGADGRLLVRAVVRDGGLRTVGHLRDQVVVGVQDRNAALGGRWEGLDEFAPGLGDGLAAAELADVRGADAEDDAEAGRGQAREVGDVALVAGAHLQHQVARVLAGGMDGAPGGVGDLGERQCDHLRGLSLGTEPRARTSGCHQGLRPGLT
jgi:hypothetical protein